MSSNRPRALGGLVNIACRAAVWFCIAPSTAGHWPIDAAIWDLEVKNDIVKLVKIEKAFAYSRLDFEFLGQLTFGAMAVSAEISLMGLKSSRFFVGNDGFGVLQVCLGTTGAIKTGSVRWALHVRKR